jgi:hypothetical protein
MMTRTILAAALAFLALTAPAHAVLLPPGTIEETVNLQFNGGSDLAGTFDFTATAGGLAAYDPSYYYTRFYVQGLSDLTLDGNHVTTFEIDAGPLPYNPAWVLLLGTGGISGDLTINTSYIQGLNFLDFALGGTPAISGTVACVGGCDVNAAPLPPALPLFASGILALGAIGWRRKRERISARQSNENQIL